MDTQTIRKRRERRHELEKRNSSLRIDSVWDMCWFQSGNLNRGCCMTVKSHELRATDARAFIKNRVGEDPPPSSFKREQPSSAHNGRLLRATGPHSLSLSLSLPLSDLRRSHPGNDERPEKYCVNSPIVSRRVATRRDASRRPPSPCNSLDHRQLRFARVCELCAIVSYNIWRYRWNSERRSI